jgi:hypothetical protein
VPGVHLEVTPQLRPRVAAPEAVGAERGERSRQEAGDLLGDEFHVIADRHEGPVGAGQELFEVAVPRRRAWMT